MSRIKRIVGCYIALPLIAPVLILGGLFVSLTFLFSYLIIVCVYVISILSKMGNGTVSYKFFINEIKHDFLDLK